MSKPRRCFAYSGDVMPRNGPAILEFWQVTDEWRDRATRMAKEGNITLVEPETDMDISVGCGVVVLLPPNPYYYEGDNLHIQRFWIVDPETHERTNESRLLFCNCETDSDWMQFADEISERAYKRACERIVGGVLREAKSALIIAMRAQTRDGRVPLLLSELNRELKLRGESDLSHYYSYLFDWARRCDSKLASLNAEEMEKEAAALLKKIRE